MNGQLSKIIFSAILVIILLVVVFLISILDGEKKSMPKRRKDTKGGKKHSDSQSPRTRKAEENPPRNNKSDRPKAGQNTANNHGYNSTKDTNNEAPQHDITQPASDQGSSPTQIFDCKDEDDPSTNNSPNAKEPTPEAPTAPEVPIKSMPHVSYFFAAPTPNGEFLHKYGTTTPNLSTSIYEIRAIDNNGKVFIYDNKYNIKILKVERDSILRPVCDLQNIPNATHTKLTTVIPGKMYLEGDKWKLSSKAIVKFE